METTNNCYSPTYKNLKVKVAGSPKEIKDKMRKDYKNKIRNNRNVLLNRFRSLITETDLYETLTEIYNNTFNFKDLLIQEINDSERKEVLEDIKNELIQDEVDWWLKEYEKSQLDYIDWSSYQQEENIICPICQKNNLNLELNLLSCSVCNISVNVKNTLLEIKNIFFDCIEKHSQTCNSDGHFTFVPEENDNHIYFVCDVCGDMNYVI